MLSALGFVLSGIYESAELLERGKVGPFAGMRIFLSTPVDYITSKPDLPNFAFGAKK
jgi:hypothetical protein